MLRRIRIHANFVEYVPLALILIFLVEQEGVSDNILHVLRLLLVIGRIMHMVGFFRSQGTSFLRAGGMVLTLLSVLIASILCLWMYFIG